MDAQNGLDDIGCGWHPCSLSVVASARPELWEPGVRRARQAGVYGGAS